MFEDETRAQDYGLTITDVYQLIGEYDEDLTKDSQLIIQNNRDFFDGLDRIDQVIVIGHSVSLVDWDYFKEVAKVVSGAKWYFGCHGLNDLRNIKSLISELSISDYQIFRTDGIRTESNQDEKEVKNKQPSIKAFQNDDILVEVQSLIFRIKQEDGRIFEWVLPGGVRKVVFIENHIFVILDDKVLLFNQKDKEWFFADQLQGFEHQNLFNKRLQHIFVREKDITFVYNNRIRVYDLGSGQQIENKAIRDAKSKRYPGKDVTKKFVK